MDEPIDAGSTQAIRSNVEAITASLGPGWSKRRLIDRFVLGSRQPPIVGSPEQVADQLIAWVNEADVDGFNLSRSSTNITSCSNSTLSSNSTPARYGTSMFVPQQASLCRSARLPGRGIGCTNHDQSSRAVSVGDIVLQSYAGAGAR
jgi:hypothetical protein